MKNPRSAFIFKTHKSYKSGLFSTLKPGSKSRLFKSPCSSDALKIPAQSYCIILYCTYGILTRQIRLDSLFSHHKPEKNCTLNLCYSLLCSTRNWWSAVNGFYFLFLLHLREAMAWEMSNNLVALLKRFLQKSTSSLNIKLGIYNVLIIYLLNSSFREEMTMRKEASTCDLSIHSPLAQVASERPHAVGGRVVGGTSAHKKLWFLCLVCICPLTAKGGKSPPLL